MNSSIFFYILTAGIVMGWLSTTSEEPYMPYVVTVLSLFLGIFLRPEIPQNTEDRKKTDRVSEEQQRLDKKLKFAAFDKRRIENKVSNTVVVHGFFTRAEIDEVRELLTRKDQDFKNGERFVCPVYNGKVLKYDGFLGDTREIAQLRKAMEIWNRDAIKTDYVDITALNGAPYNYPLDKQYDDLLAVGNKMAEHRGIASTLAKDEDVRCVELLGISLNYFISEACKCSLAAPSRLEVDFKDHPSYLDVNSVTGDMFRVYDKIPA